jgi:hypothetical protein
VNVSVCSNNCRQQSCPLTPRRGASSGCGLQIWSVAVGGFEWAATDGREGVLLRLGAVTPRTVRGGGGGGFVTKCYTVPRMWSHSLEGSRQRKMGRRYGTDSQRKVTRKMLKYKLCLVGVQGSEERGVTPNQQRRAHKGLVEIPKRQETTRKP